MLYFSVISSSVVPTMMWALSMCHEIIENAWLSQLLQKWVLFDHGMLKWAYPLPCFFFLVGSVGSQNNNKERTTTTAWIWCGNHYCWAKILGSPLTSIHLLFLPDPNSCQVPNIDQNRLEKLRTTMRRF